MQVTYFLDILVEDGRVMHLKGGNVGFVHIFLLLLLQILRTGKELAQHEDGQYHPHYAQRIRHGTPQGRTRSIQSELLQRLLGRTQGRRIGSGSTEDAHHVRHGDIQQKATQHRHQRTRQHHAHSQHIKPHAPAPEGTEEPRPHLKAQGIDKHHQAETLGIGKHLRVNLQPQVTGQDAGKEDERHAKRHPQNTHLAQSQPHGRNQRKHRQRLQSRVFHEQTIQPIQSRTPIKIQHRSPWPSSSCDVRATPQ